MEARARPNLGRSRMAENAKVTCWLPKVVKRDFVGVHLGDVTKIQAVSRIAGLQGRP